MNGYAVLKGASYTLAVTPDMVIHNGTTQTTEMIVNPESEYLKGTSNHLRSLRMPLTICRTRYILAMKSHRKWLRLDSMV